MLWGEYITQRDPWPWQAIILNMIKGERDKIKQALTVKAMQNEMNTESQTAFIGTSCLFTLCHKDENGIAPSLENAYAILLEKYNQNGWTDS